MLAKTRSAIGDRNCMRPWFRQLPRRFVRSLFGNVCSYLSLAQSVAVILRMGRLFLCLYFFAIVNRNSRHPHEAFQVVNRPTLLNCRMVVSATAIGPTSYLELRPTHELAGSSVITRLLVKPLAPKSKLLLMVAGAIVTVADEPMDKTLSTGAIPFKTESTSKESSP